MTDVLGWTAADALEQFAKSGMPLDPAGFRAVLRAGRRTGHIKTVGATDPGKGGGRGYVLYEIRQMQALHRDLVPWLAVPSRGDM